MKEERREEDKRKTYKYTKKPFDHVDTLVK